MAKSQMNSYRHGHVSFLTATYTASEVEAINTFFDQLGKARRPFANFHIFAIRGEVNTLLRNAQHHLGELIEKTSRKHLEIVTERSKKIYCTEPTI